MLKKKSISVAILFVTVLLASSGCEKRADVVNVQEYSQDGIFFSLPGNWDVSEDVPESEETFRYIIVETPGDALFMLFKYPKEDSSGLEEFAKGFVDDMRGEISFGELSSVDQHVIEEVIDGEIRKGIKYKFDIVLLGETVPHEQTHFKLPQQQSDIFLITQVADEDKGLVDPGFELIFESIRFAQ